MSSAIQYLTENISDSVKLILNEYKGIREEELDVLNPEYSCVICSKNYSKECGHASITNSCPEHEKLDIDTFANKYNFK